MEVPLRLKIDKFSLHEELDIQANQVGWWAGKLAESQYRLDTLESELELRKAELAKDIRDDPKAYGSAKTTDETVKSLVIIQPEYQALTKKINLTKYEVSIYKSAVLGLEHKKRSLTLLVDLYTREYYSSDHSGRFQRNGNQSISTENLSDEEKSEVRARGQRRLQERELDELDDK